MEWFEQDETGHLIKSYLEQLDHTVSLNICATSNLCSIL